MSIDLYYMSLSPPCRAVLMATKQMNIKVNLKTIDLRNGEQNSPEFLKLNPAHSVPTIVDNGFALWESRAIMQYLANKFAPNSSIYPSDLKKRAIVDRTLNFDMTLGSSIGNAITYKLLRGIEPTELQITTYHKNLQLLDTLIGDQKYVAGNELTIADLSVLATLGILVVNDYKDLDAVPHVKTWFKRMEKELSYYNEVNGHLKEFLDKFLAQKK